MYFNSLGFFMRLSRFFKLFLRASFEVQLAITCSALCLISGLVLTYLASVSHFYLQKPIALAKHFERSVSLMDAWNLPHPMTHALEACASPEQGPALGTVELFQSHW